MPVFGQKNSADTEATAKYLESIRSNEALLTAFFNMMPKGGDLHHHFSGSVYGETYLEFIKSHDQIWVNTKTLFIEEEKPSNLSPEEESNWKTVGQLKASGEFSTYGELLLRRWSVKDYDASRPQYEQFFESFSFFGLASDHTIKEGLIKIKERAKAEHLQYIETQFKSVKFREIDMEPFQSYDELLWTAQEQKDEASVKKLLHEYLKKLEAQNLKSYAIAYNKWVADLHQGLSIDDKEFTMRYQAFVKRFQNPSKLFASTLAAFMAADNSDLVVGVNILAPEHQEVAMRDYWLHMQMFKFCHELFPKVRYSLHAGELALGMVKPEELTWHISEAIYTAGATRIGHGVDIYHEKNCYELLNYMRTQKIAIEINLSSNEFILGITGDAHPISLYNAFQVPIVISTDDAGVLRNNLSQQYIILAQRYPQFSYKQIKELVYNSIKFSFIESKSLKKRLFSDLDKLFAQFEHTIVEYALAQQKK